jgi:hypothetical protein
MTTLSMAPLPLFDLLLQLCQLPTQLGVLSLQLRDALRVPSVPT